MTKQLICPQCRNKLIKVVQSCTSALNPDQFDAVKAGDYYCQTCPDNDRGSSKLCYWWTHELLDSEEYDI